jgi:Tat protein translocase TatB subunit
MGFSIGPWEVLLIFVVIVIVLGPHRLPEIARTLGKWVRAIRKAGSDLSSGITRELEESKKQTPSPPEPAPATKETPEAPQKPESPVKGGRATKSKGHQQKNE